MDLKTFHSTSYEYKPLRRGVLLVDEIETKTQRINYEKFYIICHDQWFKEYVTETRKKLWIGSKPFDTAKKYENWVDFMSRQEFDYELHVLEGKACEEQIESQFYKDVYNHYNIKDIFEAPLAIYLRFGVITAPRFNVSFIADKQKDYIEVRVYERLTTEDFRDLKEMINLNFSYHKPDELNSTIKSLDSIEKDIELHLLKQQLVHEDAANDPDAMREMTTEELTYMLHTDDEGKDQEWFAKETRRIHKRLDLLNKRVSEYFPNVDIKIIPEKKA